VLLVLSAWRSRPGFAGQAFLTNSALMTGGFTLTGYHLVGYFLAGA
jgi:hypothetical protein